MEDGSLLPNALRSMQKLRENEQNLNFPFHHFFEPQQKDENNRPLDSNLHLGTRNALVISLYCIDSGAGTRPRENIIPRVHGKEVQGWIDGTIGTRDQHAMGANSRKAGLAESKNSKGFFCCRIWMDAEVNDLVWN